MNANEILTAVKERYEELHSYCDEGMVLSQWEGEKEADKIAFKTWFVRPDQFRFEWIWHQAQASSTMEGIVWSNLNGAFFYENRTRIVSQEKSLPLAIAGATGVSLGAAHTIPALLMRETGGFRILDLQRPSANEEISEGVRCYRVSGYHASAISELLISSEDFLIRRVNENSYTTEIRNNIRINEAIDPEIFEFTPPRL